MGIFSPLFFWNRQKPASLSGTTPQNVVADFGELLEAHVPGTVADVEQLPYPKDEIKRDILLMLTVAKDPQLREHLKIAYIFLSEWQVGVGPTHKGLDAATIDFTKSPLDLANEVASRAEDVQKWQPIVKAEEEALIGELRKLGFW